MSLKSDSETESIQLEDSTEIAIKEFNNINFSNIIRDSFHQNDNEIENYHDISKLAENAVENAMHIPRSYYCPFCANEYMFEFTLKDHLKRFHREDLIKYVEGMGKDKLDVLNGNSDKHNMYPCPYCGALFYLIGLMPKHIANHHGNDILRHWQLSETNIDEYENKKNDESSVLFAICSPGLSDIFNNLDTNGSHRKRKMISEIDDENASTPKLRSILKKTPKSGPNIISSPSSASIRKFKAEIKRTASVRRELRFDIPSSTSSSSQSTTDDSHKEKNHNGCSPLTSSSKQNTKITNCLNLKTIFSRKYKRSNKKSNKIILQPAPTSSTRNLVTSTPISFLDDDNDFDDQQLWQQDKRNWNSSKIKAQNGSSIKPLFYINEKYQCAKCKKTWDNNYELLKHIKDNHNNIKDVFKPRYRCSLCGSKFYRNYYLIKHCHHKHTLKF